MNAQTLIIRRIENHETFPSVVFRYQKFLSSILMYSSRLAFLTFVFRFLHWRCFVTYPLWNSRTLFNKLVVYYPNNSLSQSCHFSKTKLSATINVCQTNTHRCAASESSRPHMGSKNHLVRPNTSNNTPAANTSFIGAIFVAVLISTLVQWITRKLSKATDMISHQYEYWFLNPRCVYLIYAGTTCAFFLNWSTMASLHFEKQTPVIKKLSGGCTSINANVWFALLYFDQFTPQPFV
jgi:hypothetical protein